MSPVNYKFFKVFTRTYHRKLPGIYKANFTYHNYHIQ